MNEFKLLVGDVFEKLAELPDDSVDCIVTSPPYWGLRDYGYEGQIGLEPTLGQHLAVMVAVFEECRRVLKPEGTLWLNYGDCYATKPNGRSAADTKAAGNDDRTFRDKPFSTVGPIYPPDPGNPFPAGVGRRGGGNAPSGPVYAAGDTRLVTDYAKTVRGKTQSAESGITRLEGAARVVGDGFPPPIARLQHDDSARQQSRRGRSGNLGNGGKNGVQIPDARVVGDGPHFVPLSAKRQAARGAPNGGFTDGKRNAPPSPGQVHAGGFLKPKDLCMLPNRVAIALQDAGWWVRSEIVWGKPNAMPDSSGKYRPSTSHEKIFLCTKSAKSYYDSQAVKMPVTGGTKARVAQNVAAQAGSKRANGGTRADRPMKAVGGSPYAAPSGWDFADGAHGTVHREGRRQPGQHPKTAAANSGTKANESFQGATLAVVTDRYLRNYEPDLSPLWRDNPALAELIVWEINTASFSDSHFATFPAALVTPCIMAGCPEGGVVLDPFGGAGTTALVAQRLARDSILIEMSEEYAEMARQRVLNGDIGFGF